MPRWCPALLRWYLTLSAWYLALRRCTTDDDDLNPPPLPLPRLPVSHPRPHGPPSTRPSRTPPSGADVKTRSKTTILPRACLSHALPPLAVSDLGPVTNPVSPTSPPQPPDGIVTRTRSYPRRRPWSLRRTAPVPNPASPTRLPSRHTAHSNHEEPAVVSGMDGWRWNDRK
ncbi:hypothetical protein B0H16DRAFT_1750162 [Mycena metata]|uniref:Secreted protein n=1 Tax=Mycena metata TaxID=1033252 RepID=A0AAD7GJ28_9AGAR|nr:hypothetical protein B0H16DRAFT_1750162 [Mycena metata]